MTDERFNTILGLLSVVFLLALFLPPTAFASGDDIRQTIGDTNVDVKGGTQDISVTGDSYDSLGIGLGHSLGDVDINDCLASTQKSNVIWASQKVSINLWCAGESYDARGLHSAAARARCAIEDIRALFDSDAECIELNTVQKSVPVEPPEIEQTEEYVPITQATEDHDEFEARLAAIERRDQQRAAYARQSRQIAATTLKAYQEAE